MQQLVWMASWPMQCTSAVSATAVHIIKARLTQWNAQGRRCDPDRNVRVVRGRGDGLCGVGVGAVNIHLVVFHDGLITVRHPATFLPQ